MFSTLCSSLSNHILHTDSNIFHDSWECFLRDIANIPANVVLELIKRPWSGIGINLVFQVPPQKKSQVGLRPEVHAQHQNVDENYAEFEPHILSRATTL